MQWPAVLGSGSPVTGIAKIVTASSAATTARAVSLMLTTAGKLKVCGDRNYGNGDGAALLSAATSSFQDAAGAIASETVTKIGIGGGEFYTPWAITSAGEFWLCGYMVGMGLFGAGAATNISTFGKPTMPTGIQGSIRTAISAGSGATGALAVATSDKIASIGYDNVYATGKKTSSTAAAAQTWGLALGVRDTIDTIAFVGDSTVFGIELLTTFGELRYCGGNDQGQGGTQPGNLHSVDSLQPCRLAGPRVIKTWTSRGDYSSSATYSYNDVVLKDGSLWRYTGAASDSGTRRPRYRRRRILTGRWRCRASRQRPILFSSSVAAGRRWRRDSPLACISR